MKKKKGEITSEQKNALKKAFEARNMTIEFYGRGAIVKKDDEIIAETKNKHSPKR